MENKGKRWLWMLYPPTLALLTLLSMAGVGAFGIEWVAVLAIHGVWGIITATNFLRAELMEHKFELERLKRSAQQHQFSVRPNTQTFFTQRQKRIATAKQILGLGFMVPATAQDVKIAAARALKTDHPDNGGNGNLITKIKEERDYLLNELRHPHVHFV